MDLFITADWGAGWQAVELLASLACAWAIIDIVLTPISKQRITISKGV